jgi:Fic family protein
MKEDATWEEIEARLALYNSLNTREIIDHEKFYLYSIIAHSTAIEGATLTELDTRLLLDDGITAKGKPLVHHLMTTDLRDAYLFARQRAGEKTPFTPGFLRELNALVMKSTGGVIHAPGGSFDTSQGDLRLCEITAGPGGDLYVNYLKVPALLAKLCDELNARLDRVKTPRDAYNLSFDAHLNLVTVHPWADGNGRSSRLLMNYVQFYHDLPPARIYKENKARYIASLVESRELDSSAPFRSFMSGQLLETLQEVTSACTRSRDGEVNFLF